MAKAGSTEKVVREIRRHTRRRFSAEEKIRIVLEGLRGEESIAALCRREGLAPNLYYRWSKAFLEAGKKRLLGDTTREATSTEVQDLRRENSQLKQVVAEAVLENRVLKKIWWSPVRGTIRATDRGREARDHPACRGLGSVGAPYAALVRGCGQAYALQTVEPVTYRCGTRRVCQALVHESELARNDPHKRLLTYRYRTTLARQGPSSDLGCCMRAAPRPFALLACALEGQCR